MLVYSSYFVTIEGVRTTTMKRKSNLFYKYFFLTGLVVEIK